MCNNCDIMQRTFSTIEELLAFTEGKEYRVVGGSASIFLNNILVLEKYSSLLDDSCRLRSSRTGRRYSYFIHVSNITLEHGRIQIKDNNDCINSAGYYWKAHPSFTLEEI